MRGFRHGRFSGVAPNIFIIAFVLFVLSKKEAHGYELFELMAKHFPNLCPCKGPSWMGSGYKILRELEIQGFITSRWETGEGPAKRIYSITHEGKALKEHLVLYMKDLKDQIDKLLELAE